VESLLPGTTLLRLHGEKGGRNPAQRLAGSVPGPRHGSALKGTCGLNTFLLKTRHGITGEPHPSSLDSEFLLREHEPLGQTGV